jgi:hypothetical protein
MVTGEKKNQQNKKYLCETTLNSDRENYSRDHKLLLIMDRGSRRIELSVLPQDQAILPSPWQATEEHPGSLESVLH